MTVMQNNASIANNIVFVDTSIASYEALGQGVLDGTIVVFLDLDQDGVTQITQVLEGYQNLQSIQIISHGQPGSIRLGNSQLNLDRLSDTTTQSQLSQWSDSLQAGGDLLLYGCNVGQGILGSIFLQQLQALTQLDVAASTDLTGSSVAGGDWELEIATGTIESSIALNPVALQEFQGTLGDLTLSRTLFFGGSAADEAIGVEVNSSNIIVSAGNVNGVGTLFRLSPTAGTNFLSQTTLVVCHT